MLKRRDSRMTNQSPKGIKWSAVPMHCLSFPTCWILVFSLVSCRQRYVLCRMGRFSILASGFVGSSTNQPTRLVSRAWGPAIQPGPRASQSALGTRQPPKGKPAGSDIQARAIEDWRKFIPIDGTSSLTEGAAQKVVFLPNLCSGLVNRLDCP